MKWFSNLKILHKLLIAFSIIAIAVIIVNTVVVLRIQLVEEHNRQIIEKRLPSLYLVTAMGKFQAEMRIKEYKLVVAETNAEKKQINDELLKIYEGFDSNNNAFAGMIYNESEISVYRQFLYLRDKYMLFHREIKEAANNEHDTNAKELLFVKSKKLYDEMQQKLKSLETLNKESSQNASESALNLLSNSVNLLVVLFSLGFLFVLIFSYWVSRKISNPIKRLNEATSILSTGGKGKELAIESNDEIGSLSASFNLMSRNIDSTMSELQKLNQTLEQKIRERTHALELANCDLKNLVATKDRFFSIIAHDLRSPMGSLVGISDLLKDNYKNYSDEEKIELIALLHQSASNSFELLENLLEWGMCTMNRIKFQPENICINELIEANIELCSAVAASKKINLESRISEKFYVFADRNMINTVLRNLLANALKFTNITGSVTISCVLKDNNVEILIADTGQGISEENLSKLFRLDVRHSTKGTANETGTGLGLLLCKEFVEKNAGKIWVESEIGKGSKFYFTLPCREIANI